MRHKITRPRRNNLVLNFLLAETQLGSAIDFGMSDKDIDAFWTFAIFDIFPSRGNVAKFAESHRFFLPTP